MFFSSTQESNLIPPSFIFFFTSRTFQQPHQLLHIIEKREREEKDCYSSATPPPMEIEVAERTKPVEISVHHATLPRPPPHRRLSSSPRPGWARSACSFFFIFFFSYFFVLIQLYFKNWILFCILCLDYVRNGENERKKNPKERERIDIIVASIIF